MKKLIIISILLLVGTIGFGQNRKNKKLLSYSFTNEDSLSIQISYSENPNCIESERGYLLIAIINDSVSIRHRPPKTQKTEFFEVKNNSAFNQVFKFEKTAKKEEACGGFKGGNGVEAKLTINGSTTKLFYCKDHWDGIGELISNIKNQK